MEIVALKTKNGNTFIFLVIRFISGGCHIYFASHSPRPPHITYFFLFPPGKVFLPHFLEYYFSSFFFASVHVVMSAPRGRHFPIATARSEKYRKFLPRYACCGRKNDGSIALHAAWAPLIDPLPPCFSWLVRRSKFKRSFFVGAKLTRDLYDFNMFGAHRSCPVTSVSDHPWHWYLQRWLVSSSLTTWVQESKHL